MFTDPCDPPVLADQDCFAVLRGLCTAARRTERERVGAA